jgi:hypothetical protein
MVARMGKVSSSPSEATGGGIMASNEAATDPVNHPSHYTSHPARCACGAGIECIQITEHLSFLRGNALKYLWRADLKGGLEDLRKARFYIDREIANMERSNG